MVRLDKSNINISLLEKLIINFSFPADFLYHVTKSAVLEDKYGSQTFSERIYGIWQGKINKYHKLLIIKENHNGRLPERIKNICKASPCGYVRLLLTYV